MLMRCLLVLALVFGSAPTRAETPDRLPEGAYELIERERADLLLDAVVLWLSSNFDLPAVYDHPELRLVPDETLSMMAFGHDHAGAQRSIEAVYDMDEGVLYLSDTWTHRTPSGLSVLVHEMVHHLQTFAQRGYACSGEREKPAYEAQESWLRLFGRSLEQDFGINPLAQKMLTTCLYL